MSSIRMIGPAVALGLAAFTGSAASAPAGAQATGPSSSQSSTQAASQPGSYTGYGGTRWSTDYGIGAGRCDRDRIVLETESAPKTLVQRHEENLKNRTVGIIGATGASGVLLSTTRLGGRFDDRDRHCLGHVLELGTTGREVRWSNPAMRQSYVAVVTEVSPGTRIPGATGIGARDRCRVLVLTTATGTGVNLGGARGQAQTLVACQANPGVWSIR